MSLSGPLLLSPSSSSLSLVPLVPILLLLSHHAHAHDFMYHYQIYKQQRYVSFWAQCDSLTLTCLHPVGSCFRQLFLAPMCNWISRGSYESFYVWRHHTPLCRGQGWLPRKNSQCYQTQRSPTVWIYLLCGCCLLRFPAIFSLNFCVNEVPWEAWARGLGLYFFSVLLCCCCPLLGEGWTYLCTDPNLACKCTCV